MANIQMLLGVITQRHAPLGSWAGLVKNCLLETLSFLFRLTACDSLMYLSLKLSGIILLNLRKLGVNQKGMGSQALRT